MRILLLWDGISVSNRILRFGKASGLEKKLETGESEKRIDDLRREDNDTDIDQVIDYQNRSQQQIGLAQQIQHPPANRRIVPPDLAHIVARKRKKAVSEPETNAETNSRNKVTQHSTTT